jgi:hypothetical protein
LVIDALAHCLNMSGLWYFETLPVRLCRTAISAVLPHYCTTETCRCVFFEEEPHPFRALLFLASNQFCLGCSRSLPGSWLWHVNLIQLDGVIGRQLVDS